MSLIVWVYLHILFSHCCLPKVRSLTKFRENLKIWKFKVIRGGWFWYQLESKTSIVTVVLSCTVS